MNIYKTTLINLHYKDPDFYGFKWVLKAITKENYPFKLNVIKIEKDMVVATDGYRLHVYRPQGLFLSGVYIPLIKTRTKIVLEKVSGINYPEWEQLLVTKGTFEELELGRIDSPGYTEIVRLMNKELTLKFEYFSDLADEMTKAFIPTAPGEGILFENFDGSMKALIMPMKV